MGTAAVVRVFTRGDTGGNLLGIVTDLDGLDGSSMQDIAARFGYSETIFVEPDSGEVRIFTPAAELPFAGHPLVGAAWLLGGTGTLRCGVGDIPFSADARGAAVDVALTPDVTDADGAAIAAWIGVAEPVAAWWAHMPVPYLIMDLGLAHGVLTATPDLDALAEVAGKVTMLIARDGAAVVARCFAPALGVDEDPATGSAAVALAAVCAASGESGGALSIDQGDAIGHPSRLDVSWQEGRARLSGTVRREPDRTW